MRWDDFITEDEDVGGVATQPEKLLPDGTHVGKIGWVQIGSKDWAKKDGNDDGLCLTVRVDVSGHKSVFQSIPCHWRGAIEELCRSARVAPPAKGKDWDEDQLLDQVVSVETLLSVSRAGNEFVKVTRFKPTSQSDTPKPKQVRQTKTQQVDVETSAATDDIPF